MANSGNPFDEYVVAKKQLKFEEDFEKFATSNDQYYSKMIPHNLGENYLINI